MQQLVDILSREKMKMNTALSKFINKIISVLRKTKEIQIIRNKQQRCAAEGEILLNNNTLVFEISNQRFHTYQQWLIITKLT